MTDPKELLEGTTPGPWDVDEYGIIIQHKRNEHGYREPIKTLSAWREDAWEGDKEAMANMRLAAAAPDLARDNIRLQAELDAMRERVEALENGGSKVAWELKRLRAIVRGECPSLLDDDDGGTPPDMDGEAALENWTALLKETGR